MKGNVRKKIINLFVSFLFVLLSVYFLFIGFKDLALNFKLNDDVKKSQEEIAQLEAKNEQLENQRAKLQDPEYVKNYARGAYMLSKDGEQVFHLAGGE